MWNEKQKLALKEVGLKVRNITRQIDGGADGLIYNYDQDKVIKIANNDRLNQDALFERMWYITKPRKCVVKIYNWGKLPSYTFTNYGSDNSYYIIMEKLNPVSSDICDFFDYFRHYIIDFLEGSNEPWHDYKGNLNEKNKKRVHHFLTSVRQLKWWHHDMHGHNIMQDNAGNLKLIDPESLAPRFKIARDKATERDRGQIK